MMPPKHHPDEATLLSYAAGSLSAGAKLLLDCHLACCESCQRKVAQVEAFGGELLQAIPSAVMHCSIDQILAKLDSPEQLQALQDGQANVKPHAPEWLPEWAQHLSPWLDHEQKDKDLWQRVAPGISQIRFDHERFAADKAVRLLRIAPGTCMPKHGHSGSELTLILQGSYSDETGRFCAGDVADLDPDIKHQPIADRDTPCICLIVTDAPLRFEGWIPKLMQPFFGL